MGQGALYQDRADIPDLFCWTKFGTEAGEDISAILARKEAERLENQGIFLWGIGNAVGPSIAELLAATASPRVLFTPMRSKPAEHDVTPREVAVWRSGFGLAGEPYEVPAGSRVTSRATSARMSHYALVCKAESALTLDAPLAGPTFSASDVVNLRSGNRVGASQVTSVVRRVACGLDRSLSPYRVAFAACLVEPYLVTLTKRDLVAA